MKQNQIYQKKSFELFNELDQGSIKNIKIIRNQSNRSYRLKRTKRDKPIIIIIAGAASSGKTYIASTIMQQIKKLGQKIVYLKEKNYFVDLTQKEIKNIQNYNFEKMEAVN